MPVRLNRLALFYFDSYICSLTSSKYLARLVGRFFESRHNCGAVGIDLSFPFERKVLTAAINHCPSPDRTTARVFAPRGNQVLQPMQVVYPLLVNSLKIVSFIDAGAGPAFFSVTGDR